MIVLYIAACAGAVTLSAGGALLPALVFVAAATWVVAAASVG